MNMHLCRDNNDGTIVVVFGDNFFLHLTKVEFHLVGSAHASTAEATNNNREIVLL